MAILPTGRTEWLGLARALGRLFPDHEFYCLPTTAEVDSAGVLFPYGGFTSSILTTVHEVTPPESARELVSRAAQEALGDRRKRAADLVFIIDDVELPNMGQIDRVVAVMHQAVAAHLAGLQRTDHHARTMTTLREKVSFHLIAPMIESWFFADRGALAAVGVPATTTVCFSQTTDPEVFVTDDAAYLAATEADCPALAALTPQRRKKVRPKWLGSQPRERHPKGYIQWLCRAPDQRGCTGYSETSQGGPALAEISWPVLLGRNVAHFGLLRALVEDLAGGLACEPAVHAGSPAAHMPTELSRAPHNALLRNL